MIVRTIHEWGRIGYGTSLDKIPEEDAERVAGVARSSVLAGDGGDGVLVHERHCLKAKGVVGMIATPNCQLEILPKIDSNRGIREDDSNSLFRKNLIYMLSVVDNLKVDHGTISEVSWQKDTVLELLISLFCEEVSGAIRKGVPYEYISYEDDLSVIRGRLDIVRQFSTNIMSPHRLACQFDILSCDIALNQLIRLAVTKLLNVSQLESNRQRLRQIYSIYADVTNIDERVFRDYHMTIDRSNHYWSTSASLAKKFVLGRHQDIRYGSEIGWSLLFDMSKLFERYVSLLFYKAFNGTALEVILQDSDSYSLYKEGAGVRSVRPDLVIAMNGRAISVVDMKWKKVSTKNGSLIGCVPRNDIYQMIVYSKIFRCDAMLLYPRHSGILEHQIAETYAITAPDSRNQLVVATVDVTEDPGKQIDSIKNLFNFECARPEVA